MLVDLIKTTVLVLAMGAAIKFVLGRFGGPLAGIAGYL